MAGGNKNKSTKKKAVAPKPKRRTKNPSLLAAAGRTIKTTPRRRPTKKT